MSQKLQMILNQIKSGEINYGTTFNKLRGKTGRNKDIQILYDISK